MPGPAEAERVSPYSLQLTDCNLQSNYIPVSCGWKGKVTFQVSCPTSPPKRKVRFDFRAAPLPPISPWGGVVDGGHHLTDYGASPMGVFYWLMRE